MEFVVVLNLETPHLTSFSTEATGRVIAQNGVKRSFDILFSLMALILGLPVFAIIALLVKLSSPGPIFYCSLRIGRGGRLFKFWKFRSMHRDADQRLDVILNSDPQLKREWQKYFKLQKDPRLTPIGRFLRKSSFDELPQFWNVLSGDLSIVGPRPYLPREAEALKKVLGKDVDKVFHVRPGITGIWQTQGRSQLTFEERAILEANYVDKCSLCST